MPTIHERRIAKLRDLIKGREDAAALISTSPHVQRTHDQDYPYRQNSNFYYLTGSTAPRMLLVITTKSKTPFLLAEPVDKARIVWEGLPENPKPIAKEIGAELVITNNFERETLTRLRGIETLYVQNIPGSSAWKVSEQIFARRGDTQSVLPKKLALLDLVMQELRLYKDPQEVKLIKEASETTCRVLHKILPLLKPGVTEWEIAQTINYHFGLAGGLPSFDTIVASGPSAAYLHYTKCSRTLRAGEMILIDSGVELGMYAGDVTRTLPVGGRFTPQDKELYSIVLDAQKAAVNRVKDGVKIQRVFDAAAEVLTYGLVQLKVLRGKVSNLLASKAYKPFFPHGIGHSLGLDVHDIGNLRANNGAVLKEGMVVTIEPGLYFAKRTGKVAPSGVRIEDDVLVTSRGGKILSTEFPKEIKQIEALF
jgi:Xaa-Pro aminopeptidase